METKEEKEDKLDNPLKNKRCKQEEHENEHNEKAKYTGYKTFFGQNIASSISISQTHQDPDESFCAMSARKKGCFFAFFFVDFCAGTFYSLLGPFFPNEAQSKGISYTLTGFVFSVYPVVYIIISPFVGRYLGTIGAKFVFLSGILFCGTCAILFGTLEYVEDATTYAAMCILVRAFQAAGGAAFNTATFAMVATMFPGQMATMFGLLEVSFGLGTMMGPPVGGWLYELGGFKMPFIVAGSILLTMGLFCFCFVPSIKESKTKPKSLWSLVLSPLVVIVGITGATGTSGIGFLDVTLSVRLKKQFNLSPGWTGLVFVIAPAMFILSAPVWGRLADKKPRAAPVAMGIGTLVGGLAFWMMGPAPFLRIPDTELWLLMLSYGIMGLAVGTHVVNGKIMAEEARLRGHPKNLETMGMLSGLISSFNSVGSFLGPLVGGYLNDRFQFPGAAAIIGAIIMTVGCLLLLYLLIQCLVQRRSRLNHLSESSMLLSSDSLGTSTPGPNSRADSEVTNPSNTPLFIRKHGVVTPTHSSTEDPPSYQIGQDVEKEVQGVPSLRPARQDYIHTERNLQKDAGVTNNTSTQGLKYFRESSSQSIGDSTTDKFAVNAPPSLGAKMESLEQIDQEKTSTRKDSNGTQNILAADQEELTKAELAQTPMTVDSVIDEIEELQNEMLRDLEARQESQPEKSKT